MTAGPDDTWTITTPVMTAPFEFKPLLDDATWSRGPNYKAAPGATLDVYPHFTQVQGTWSRAYDFTSTILGNTRGIWIYLPPTYIENTRASMPVVYMHDGQNLFDPSAAFGGNTWQVQQTMDAAAEDGSIAEAIVVGAENTADRMSEYTPVPDPTQSPAGGNGEKYLQMLITELKPKIDHDMRTLPDAAHTAMVGSSLGGLITAYAGVKHADVYGLVGVMSPSTWWDSNWIVGEVGMTPGSPRPLRVYVDSGDSGPSNDDVTNTAMLAAAYQTMGYAKGSTLDYVVQMGGQHNEVYWAQRLPGTLAFLLGPGR
jgi:predicted alpha/beta superfamily hydrolase